MPNIQKTPQPVATPLPASPPIQAALPDKPLPSGDKPKMPAEVYGPPSPKDDYKASQQGNSDPHYDFIDDGKFDDNGNLLDKVRDKMGDEAFYGAAGAGVAGALAAGAKVKLKVGLEDQLNLPNARLELRAALKENNAARELRENGSAATLSQMLNYPQGDHKPRGAGVSVSFKTNF